jgi:hypothetical protein
LAQPADVIQIPNIPAGTTSNCPSVHTGLCAKRRHGGKPRRYTFQPLF